MYNCFNTVHLKTTVCKGSAVYLKAIKASHMRKQSLAVAELIDSQSMKIKAHVFGFYKKCIIKTALVISIQGLSIEGTELTRFK